MDKHISFNGYIKNGKLTLANRGLFQAYLNSLEGQVSLTIKKPKRIRSLPQNALYWVYITIIADSLGCSTEEIHSTFKAMFLTDRSGPLPVVRSTTRLNKVEFSAYIEMIAAKVAELGIVLPEAK